MVIQAHHLQIRTFTMPDAVHVPDVFLNGRCFDAHMAFAGLPVRREVFINAASVVSERKAYGESRAV